MRFGCTCYLFGIPQRAEMESIFYLKLRADIIVLYELET